MKWLSKEPFSFDDDEYSDRARNMSAHALWMRQCKKSRTKVSSCTGIGYSIVMLIPTMGASTFGLMTNGRTLDIARRKRKVIDAEARRRHLPDYQKTKRDILIPLGVSLSVFATVGLLDVLFSGGASAPILNGAAEQGTHALPVAAQDPSHFFLGAWHGAELQAHQIFHNGSQILAVGSDPGHVVTGTSGLHSAANGLTPVPANTPIGAAAITASKVSATGNVHSSLATPAGSSFPTPLVLADKSIGSAAISHATPGITAELSGAHVGVSIVEKAEIYAVRCTIADTGLMDLPPKNLEEKNCANTTTAENKMRIPESIGDGAKLAQSAVLTGESQRSFQFLSKEYRPASQWVMTPKEKCMHDSEKAPLFKECSFCSCTISSEAQAYYHCCSCSDNGSRRALATISAKYALLGEVAVVLTGRVTFCTAKVC